ncbi:hypothetical protein CBL_20121, partial [Carabus blaptoides fortunei]
LLSSSPEHQGFVEDIPERPREERIKRIRLDRSPSTDSTINDEHGYIRARLSQSIQGFSKTTGQISELASIVKNLAETTSSPNLVQPGLLDENIKTIARAGNYQNPEDPFEFLKNCEYSRKIENPHDRKGGNKRKYYNKTEYTSKRTEYQHKSGVECYHCGEKGLFNHRARNHHLGVAIAKIPDTKRTNAQNNSKIFGINKTVNKTTGKSATELLYRFKPRNNADGILTAEIQVLQEMIQDIHDMREEAKNKIAAAQAIGDLVIIQKAQPSEEVSRKLRTKSSGTFQVQMVLPNERYRATDMLGSHRSQRAKYDNVIAVDKMKLYVPSGGISDDTGDEEYHDVSNGKKAAYRTDLNYPWSRNMNIDLEELWQMLMD